MPEANEISIREKLDVAENFGDVFELVKTSVEMVLKQRRAGLMLYLADLPKGAVSYTHLTLPTKA